MDVGYKNIHYTMQYKTDPRVNGIKDLNVLIVSPGNVYTRGPFVLEEIGSSGVYEATFMPKVTGSFHLKYSSVEHKINTKKILNIVDYNKNRNRFTKIIFILILLQFLYLLFANQQTIKNLEKIEEKTDTIATVCK